MGFYSGKNILVAGAGGITGHSAVKRLLEEGAYVRAAIHNSNTYDIQHPNLEIKKYDFLKKEDCIDAVKDIEIVIDSLAYVPGRKELTKSPMSFLRHNLMLFMNLAEAACEAKVDRISYIGSSAVYPDRQWELEENESYGVIPPEFYHGMGWLKKYTEQVCMYYQKITNTKFGMIRIGAVYGPHDAFNSDKNHVVSDLIMRAERKENPFVVWGDATKQIRDFIYVDDLIDGLLLTLENHAVADPINIVSGRHTTIAELVKIIINHSDYSPEIIYDITKPVALPIRILDNTKAKEILNWTSKTSLEDGINKTIKWYKENKK
jgi:GDP-L-fucose synthase